MSKTYAGVSRRSGSAFSLLAFVVLFVALMGGALLLHAAEIVRIPFLGGQKPAEAGPDRTNMVALPQSTVAIPAYAAVVPEHIYDARKNAIKFYWINKDALTPDMLVKVEDVLGGVLRRPKPPGYVFTKADFFPKGTRPGPTAGIPPGKRALRIPAKAMPGLHGLKQGDSFDVVMSIEVEIEEAKVPPARPSGKSSVEGPYAGLITPTAPPPPPAKVVKKLAEVRTIVKGGVIVEPVTTRKEIEVASSLMKGSRLEARPIEEILIAVGPAEVAALHEAMAINATLHVAMRGQVTSSGGTPVEEEEIPDRLVTIPQPAEPAATTEEAAPKFQIIETIVGGKKKLMAVPVGAPDAPGMDGGKPASEDDPK